MSETDGGVAEDKQKYDIDFPDGSLNVVVEVKVTAEGVDDPESTVEYFFDEIIGAVKQERRYRIQEAGE